MTQLIGCSLGRYRVLDQLGSGGMATVFKAYDTRLERIVAIKVIRNDLEQPDPTFLQRFELEAKALAMLSHPNIVPVHDYGDQNGIFYVVMEYLSGSTLKERLGRVMHYQEASRILAPIARALEFAHNRKIIHRDIKPANIFITQSGQPMLLDFGLAKMLEAKSHITGAGVGVGTPDYMAPEQWLGNSDPRSDIYALGIVLYEMVTGSRPYASDTPATVLYKQLNEQLPSPRSLNPTLPQEVEQVLFKALARDPNSRFQDIGIMAAALEKIMDIYVPILDDNVPRMKMDHNRLRKSGGNPPVETNRQTLPIHDLILFPALGFIITLLFIITALLVGERLNRLIHPDIPTANVTQPVVSQPCPAPLSPTSQPITTGKLPAVPPLGVSGGFTQPNLNCPATAAPAIPAADTVCKP